MVGVCEMRMAKVQCSTCPWDATLYLATYMWKIQFKKKIWADQIIPEDTLGFKNKVQEEIVINPCNDLKGTQIHVLSTLFQSS